MLSVSAPDLGSDTGLGKPGLAYFFFLEVTSGTSSTSQSGHASLPQQTPLLGSFEVLVFIIFGSIQM